MKYKRKSRRVPMEVRSQKRRERRKPIRRKSSRTGSNSDGEDLENEPTTMTNSGSE
jgi:hypothetical protein